jgi:hypothetical protein
MNQRDKRLLELFRGLSERDQESMLDYAQFLAQRTAAGTERRLPEPLDVPRPDKESVVKAMKRLSATYPMLDKSRLLHEATGLMSQHVMEGRDPDDVIDELEALFRSYYEQFVEEWGEE